MPEQDVKETILLIEDDAGIAELVCEKLGEAGRHVAHVKSGRQARAWLEHNHAGLILLNYCLPDMSGEEFVEQMGDMPPFIVIGDEAAAVTMMKRGAKDYLIKDTHFIDSLAVVVEYVLKNVAAERQLAEALTALRESEERLQLALFAAGQGLYDLNIKTGKVIVSPEYARMLGYEPSEFVETYATWRERLHPDDRERVLRADEAYFSGIGGDYRSEYRQRTKNGDWKWIISRGKIVEFDAAGKPLRMIGIHADISAHKQAEKTLKQSEMQYRLLADHMTDTVWLMDMNLKMIYTSPSVERTRGYTLDELQQLPLDQQLTPASFQAAMELFMVELPKIMADPAYSPVLKLELEFYRKDGGTFWGENTLSIIRDENGKPVSILSETRDITERVQAEEKIKETKLLLEASIESPADMVILSIDKNYRYLYFNTTHKDIMLKAYGKDVQLGMDMLECISNAEDRETAKINYDRALAGESHITIQEYADLERSFYETRYNPIVNDRKEIIGATAFSADITERKRSAEALVIQKRIADIFMTVADEDVYNEILKTILNVMRSPFGMLGYLERDGILIAPAMTRQIWDEKYHTPEKTARFPQETWKNSVWPRAIREKRVVYSNTAPANIPEGHIGMLRHISQPIMLQDEVIGILQVANKASDYTEADLNTINAIAGYIAPILQARLQREYAEAETRQLNIELEQRVVERTQELSDAQEKLVHQEKLVVMGQLAGSVGHELRNPLGVITNAIYFLKISLPDAKDKIKEYLNIVDSEARLADKIVTDLLDYARIKSLKRKSAAVSELINLALKRFPVPESVDVTLEIPADLPAVYADWYHVVQILGNLIVNAYQSMPGGGKLLVSSVEGTVDDGALTVDGGALTVDGGQLTVDGGQLTVDDGALTVEGGQLTVDGGALTVDGRQSIVNRKSQIANRPSFIVISVKDSGTGISAENMNHLFEPLFSTKINGIGLGLPVSKQLAEANGGRIEVQSEVGVGSTFTLYLPIAHEGN